MLNVPENERFSAYLDGELTAEEQAEVEQLLDASPAARQLLDELRALSTNLQALPVYELKEDLSARVLRRAEQRVLSGSPGLDSQSDSPTCDRDATVRPAILRRVLRPRNLVWSAMAVVVALALMVLDRGLPVDRQDEGQIARKPEESVDRIAPTAEIPVAEIPVAEIPVAEIPAAEIPATDNRATAPEIRAAEDPDVSAVASVETPTPGEKEPGPTPDATRAPVSSTAAPTDVAQTNTALRPASGRQNGPAEPSEDNLPARPADLPEPASPIDRLLVVRCNVPTRAVGKQTLGEILARRKIPRLEAVDRTTGKTYVEVELTPTQMRAVMADLKARPETFAILSAPPTPGAAGPRIPSAAGTTRGMKRPIQVTPAVPRNPNPDGKKNSLTGPSPSSRRTGSPISARLQRIEVQVGGQGRAVVSPRSQAKPDPQAKVENLTTPRSTRSRRLESPSRSEPKIRVRFEFSVVEAQAEVKRKESDSTEKTDPVKSADDAP